ncbi:MAG: hypothetical protein LC099_11650 [Anaerolineales bacterium]|nr:hypothetical protein [Anaerolineales bacterium]
MNDESKSRLKLPVALFVLLIAFSAAYYARNQSRIYAPEQTPLSLQLSGASAYPDAELSGLAWHGDTLILLPQYPERFGAGDGALFALPKAQILAALDATPQTPLEPFLVHLSAPNLKNSIANFQGYEAIAFNGDQVFVTIEAGWGTDMHGYLVGGRISPDQSEIALDTSNVREIPLAFPSDNHSDEALLVVGDSILTFFEINGADLNRAPAAHVFDFDLNPKGTLPFPNIEYRITDAALDADNTFWAINYFFPGDANLAVKNDSLAEKYGRGKTHAQHSQVERLVEMTYSPDGIALTDSAPIQLTLDGDTARNLEGLEVLDDKGFLLVTDKFPTTLFLFVPKP